MAHHSLSLDNIISAMTYFLPQWSPDLKRNQSLHVLRFLLCKFHSAGGPILNARVEIAQETLATKIGISRTWCNILLGRLADAGWLTVHAPKLPDGMNSRSIILLGPTLKRMVYKLWRTPGKNPTKSAVNSPKHSVPFSERKRLEFIKRKEEEPLPEQILNRIPLLRTWLNR